MTTEELEELLEAATETQSIDFKQSCAWSVSCFAKDILAMSNVRDGGWIIVGVEEGSDNIFNRTGVNPEHRASFGVDDMRDQLAAFADPHVNISVHFPPDRSGKDYVVIRVHQFDTVPVICRKDSTDTNKGILYYRNTDRRIESAAVSNSFDMRDIIDLAAVRMMQRYGTIGFTVEPKARQGLDEELQGL